VSPMKSSAKEVNRRIDRIVEEQEKAEERHLQNSIEDRLDEAWFRFQYAEGSRVSFANIGDVSKNEKVIITDRRRIGSDPDLLVEAEKSVVKEVEREKEHD